ncbi:MAG TPA: signal peptidase II [Longimicrobium sp.]|jgi:signal peptidase II
MKISRNRWLSLGIAGVVAADWITKFWVQNEMFYGSVRPLVGGWVWFTHRRNYGVSFSAFAGYDSPLKTPLLLLAACLGVAVALHILRSSRDGWVKASAALVVAGALGNLGDRLMDGAVTDFILVRFFPFVFNVADVAITVGAIVLATRLVRDAEAPPSDPSTAT